ncbi:MAG: hypothetical protein WC523_01900 [Patescibacteria group bacterium]|jgi:hypothetical protein
MNEEIKSELSRVAISQIGQGNRSADELGCFKMTGVKDILNQLGPISKKEYDYYENL